MANNTGKKFGGREKGTPNKQTAEIKEMFITLLHGNLDDMQDCLDSMKAPDRFNAYISIAKYVLPTMKAVELTAEVGFIQPVVINIGEDEKD